jgi:pSer/pThr/pTyr-binding forkhead associated (FHA) protein
VNGAEAAVEDLGSRNGTYVQGVKVTSPMRLSDGDEIRLGSVVLIYRLNTGQETTISTPA